MSSPRILTGVLALLLLATGTALAGTLVRLERPELYELTARGFELPRDAEVGVEAIGLTTHDENWLRWVRHDDGADLSVYAWILNADTRRPVWRMQRDRAERLSGSRRLLRAEETFRLPAGRYELYFFAGQSWLPEPRPATDDRAWWERMFGGEGRYLEDLEADLADCFVTLTAEGLGESDVTWFDVTGDLGDALIRHQALGDSALAQTGFVVREAMTLRAYGVVERTESSDQAADYSWIVEADSRERIWDGARAAVRHAGGGRKNRLVDDEIRLEPGRYVLYTGTDDSHSFERFNVNPPHDPFAWGLALRPGDDFDSNAFDTFEPRDGEPAPIGWTQTGDRELREQAFRLARDGAVWVRALGEYVDRTGEFADGAWITEAATGRTVWEMSRRNTTGAGGADKNRMFDGLVDLPAGDYVVYYATDGSHSFAEWNVATPFEPEAWGLVLRPGPELDPGDLVTLREEELAAATNILVRIARVGDDEYRTQRFTLERRTRVRIAALGEGTDRRMYDYGYLTEGESGRTVWEMRWDDTDHAGGGEKNRMIDEELVLEPGTYEAVYVSDDSHSFDGWNVRRPDNPLLWGMTIRLVEP